MKEAQLKHRPRSVVLWAALLSTVGGLLVWSVGDRSAVVDAAPGAAVFEPIDGAVSFGPAAFGRVVADGNGTFLAVQRVQLPIGQFIGVRRSDDGGRTWVTKGLFAGTNGGGTRPWISVSGSHVAVGYIGGWCDPSTPGLCGEAPFLVTSRDGGSSWGGGPRRLDRQAFEIRVAQDGDRTWVAWERSGNVELRGTRDGGATMFATRSVAAEGVPELAASGGLAVVAYRGIVDRLTRAPLALTAVGDVVAGAASPLGDPFGDHDVVPLAVAVADGRMHVLVRRTPKADPGPNLVEVMTATPAGAFATVNVIGEAGRSASLVAGPGTVAVAIGGDDGVTSVATSSDGGDTFSSLVPVSNTGEREPNVQIGLAVRPTDRPIARFGWSVPPRLVDEDGDGLIDPANDTGIDSADQLRVYGGRTLEVTIDGCASTAPPGRTIASYRWTEVQPDGSTVVLPFGACTETLSFESGEERTLRLDVVDSAGERSSTVQVVAPRDLVVASLGDSVASGEGNPHEPAAPGFPARWQDRACHRSVDAGPAVAAKRLEDADPHTSVTFVQLACSGAAVVDSPEVAGIDDPTTGGVLDSYIGQEPAAGSLRPSQIQQLAELLGARRLDALMLSVGANDARFSDAVKACITTSHCERTSVRTQFESRAAELPGRYARLAAAIADLGVDPSAVHISEYFDPTIDELGVVEMRCAVLGGVFDLLDDDEARWAATGMMAALNSAVSAASAAHGWKYVGGVAAAFAGHGYCSTDPWVVGVAESQLSQGNIDGAFHPNGAGHAAYARALYASLRGSLLLPAPVASGGTAVGSDLLGDLIVMTATRSSIVATGLRDTGGVPGVIGSRVIDRIVSGEGGLYSFGPPAIDRTAAVGVWTQLPFSGLTLTEELGAQIAVRPNAAVRAVSVVQAPTGGALLVANRDAVVSAMIDAAIDQPTDLDVSVDVVTLPADPDDPDAPPGRPLLAAATSVRVRPGLNKILLPTTGAFQLAPDEKVSATVTVHDPPGASPADDVDNTLSTDDSIAKEAMETRPLTIEFMSPTTGAGRVPCTDLSEIARRQIAFARAAMPTDGTGVLPMLSCGELYPLQADEASILRYLSLLDWLARHSTVDVMVGVVPGGWLSEAAGGAVGVAAPGLRAALIEQTSPAMTLAHEVAHTFGIDHATGDLRVSGVRVDQRRHLDGTDWMAARTPEKAWTGAKTWDELAIRFGPPGGIPAPPQPLAPELDINGTVTNEGEHLPGEWTPGDTGSPRDDLDDLEVERMLVEQVDGDGDVVAGDEAPLRPVEGLYAPDATDVQPIGFAYETQITLVPEAAGVRLVLDGTVVEERPVGDVPEVTVSSPASGTEIRRGDPITVEWSTAAPVGPDATASVLISQDGGATWKPLATGVTGTQAVVEAPADLVDGEAIVRVVVVDGLRSGQGDSGVIDIGVPAQLLPERVVAVRTDLIDLTVPGATLPAQPGQGIWTMDPDGTDLQEVVPMVPPVNGEGGMVPLHPDWRTDGLAIAFDGEVSGRRDLFVVDRDGGNLRRVTDATTSAGLQFVCADWHPDGRQLLSYRTSGFDPSQVTELELVVVDSATGVVTPFGWSTPNYYNPATAIGCPRWSPDGGEILMATEYLDGNSSVTDVYVIDVATKLSKYAYFPNNGALQGNAYSTWLNFAPSDDDRFVNIQELFGFGYLKVAEPVSTPLIIGQDVVYRDLPTQVWGTDTIPMIQHYTGLFGSAGFVPDGNSVWFTSTMSMQPRRYSEQRFDFRVGFYTVIVTEQVGHLCRVPVLDSYQPTDPVTCYAPGGDGTPVDAISDEAVVVPEAPSAGPTIGIAMADWHSGISEGIDPNPPIVIGDPATVPPDPEDPPPGDVDVPSPEDEPAEGADATAPAPVTAPVPTTITVPAGRTTTAVLPSADGVPSSFTIVAAADAGTVEVRPTWPSAGDPTTTGPDGAVDITPASGFVGTASFQVASRDGADPVTITVEVVPEPVPVVTDDRIEVERGTVTVVDPATLLGNDRPAVDAFSVRAVDPLRIVSVYGFGGGTAVLRLDGQIEVRADAAGSFTYTVADSSGATADARVFVQLAAAPPTTGAPTTPPPSTSGPPAAPPPTTTAPPVAPPPTSPPIDVPTTAPTAPDAGPPSTPLGGVLPATGANPGQRVRVAATTMLLGALLVLAVRRRNPTRSRH